MLFREPKHSFNPLQHRPNYSGYNLGIFEGKTSLTISIMFELFATRQMPKSKQLVAFLRKSP